MNSHPFEIVTELGRPVAALIPEKMEWDQYSHIYHLIGFYACRQFELEQRWNVFAVISNHDWARAQLKRVPMLKPKQTLKLAFLQ